MAMKRLILLALILCSLSAAAQKEVLIIGTNHSLPEVVRTSYGSLLRIAKKYKPQAIYVESIPASDTRSWDLVSEKEGEMADFWQTHLTAKQLRSALSASFNPADFGRAIGYFQYIGDYANAAYYHYRISGASKRALGNEFDDLVFPLAVALGVDSLCSFDIRTLNKPYQQAVARATAEWASNGNAEAYTLLFEKDYKRSILPAMFGTFGRQANTDAALERAHSLSSFGFAVARTEAVDDVAAAWGRRNEVMASRIGKQIESGAALRSVVFVGCQHVVGIAAALEANFPSILVKTVDRLK